jgi:hypothetical protein
MREEKFKTLEVCTILWICTRCKAALNILLGNFQNLQAVENPPQHITMSQTMFVVMVSLNFVSAQGWKKS